MTFKPPTLNLVCNIWTVWTEQPTKPSRGPDQFHIACQLRTTLVGAVVGAGLSGVGTILTSVLLPARTDVRTSQAFNQRSLLEVPAETGRFYVLVAFDDRAKGFANEHRIVVVEPLVNNPGMWPFPTP
jgi:hypothetical protein